MMQAHVQHISSFNHQVIRIVFSAKYLLICVWLNLSNTIKYDTPRHDTLHSTRNYIDLHI
jgi:hypothetical protein